MNFKKKWFDFNYFEKINFIITVFIKIILLLAIPFSVYEKNWIALFVTSLTLFLILFLPTLFEKRYQVIFPAEIQFAIVLFLYCALFLGMSRDWYLRYWWWDSLMHAFSGVALGFAGFLILYTLYKSGRLKASPFLIALLSFCFAVALGTVWEIYEFAIDSFLGRNMQRAIFSIEEIKEHGSSRIAIYDTMWDLILDSIGALVASLAGYFYLKKGEMPVLKKIVQKFEAKNPKLFNKKR